MIYAIPPSPARFKSEYEFWRGAFQFSELDALIVLLDALPKQHATVGGNPSGDELDRMRNSDVAWVPLNEQFHPLYKKMADIAWQINGSHFGLDLQGFAENLQYTVYDASKGSQHYGYHTDFMGQGAVPRKLSMVLQLSEPLSYEGGDLWLQGNAEQAVSKERGLVHCFESKLRHRVTPVTQGIRRSLVGWVTGPELR